MRALILAAGLGTRLRPLTSVRAKAAVPVNGIPLVRRVMAWLVSEGVTEQVINLHHRPASIAAVVGDGRDLGARVRYSWENPVLGSAGGPRHALPLLTDGKNPGEDVFVIVNGDTLTDVRVPALMDRHLRSGARVTMALIPNPVRSSTAAFASRTAGLPGSRVQAPDKPAITSSASRQHMRRPLPTSKTACPPNP